MGFVTLEFLKKEDADICLALDDLKEFRQGTGIKMRILRVKRFIE